MRRPSASSEEVFLLERVIDRTEGLIPAEERFIRVDIPDAGNNSLTEELGLDSLFTTLGSAPQIFAG